MKPKSIERLLFICVLCVTSSGRTTADVEQHAWNPSGNPVLWRDPGEDTATRNLIYGPGGKHEEPRGAFYFVKEELDGTSPKLVVRDEDGVKWKLKLGAEARPETTASRLIWAVGYHADEDYFVSNLFVEKLPTHLHRGQKFVSSEGMLLKVRLKRPSKERKIGTWKWADSPFTGTREWNGLRTMMALLNNWDVTDENTGIYQTGNGYRIYGVSDLGASFGAGELTWPLGKSKDNLDSYRQSKFIVRMTSEFVDFHAPHRDSLFFLATPREFFQKLHLRWIAKRVPREDARWVGQLLARLSPDQIRDSFRAAGYSPEEIEGFTTVVQGRIRQLQQL